MTSTIKQKVDVYQLVTNQIINALQEGVIPWRKTWRNGYAQAMNYASKRAYTGINALLTNLSPYDSPYFLTFKQVKELGGSVRKGAKSIPLVFYKTSFFDADGYSITEEEAKKQNNAKKRVLLRQYRVFNSEDVQGVEFKPLANLNTDNTPIEEADILLRDMPQRPEIKRGNPSYTPATDTVAMPAMKDFEDSEEYYATLFHELVHATGHESRLNREAVVNTEVFGSLTYSKEELVAEIGAAFLCRIVGIDQAQTFENSTAYIASWLEKLENDNRFIFKAASNAKYAANFILGK